MKSISSLVSNHNEYRRNCLNLQASENIMSKKALEALSSDLSGRYSHIGENGINDYGGTSIFEEIHQRTIEAAKSLFGVKLAEVSPVGGAHRSYCSAEINVNARPEDAPYFHREWRVSRL